LADFGWFLEGLFTYVSWEILSYLFGRRTGSLLQAILYLFRIFGYSDCELIVSSFSEQCPLYSDVDFSVFEALSVLESP